MILPWQAGQFRMVGHDEPVGLTSLALRVPDRCVHAVIAKRRRDPDLESRGDILSLIMRARTDDGETLSDHDGFLVTYRLSWRAAAATKVTTGLPVC